MLTLCVPPTAYNKWHETELERWLSDHDIPYPTPADRKDLEKLIQTNWDAYAVSPYKNWDNDKLAGYLQQKGVDVQDAAKSNKDSLVSQVAASWYETEDKAENAYYNVKDWILDTWTESQLKAFCDHHAIPGESAPTPGGIGGTTMEKCTRQLTACSTATPPAGHHPVEGPRQL